MHPIRVIFLILLILFSRIYSISFLAAQLCILLKVHHLFRIPPIETRDLRKETLKDSLNSFNIRLQILLDLGNNKTSYPINSDNKSKICSI